MNKPTKKRQNYNNAVVVALSEKYSFTTTYIRACLRKDRINLTADRIRKEYKELAGATEKKIEQFNNQIL